MDFEELQFDGDEMEVEVNNEEMEIEVNEEEEMDDDAILSEDSCYDTDRSDTEEIVRVLNQAEVNTLNPLKKMCCIYFYFTSGHAKFCVSCMVRISGLFSMLYADIKHDTRLYVLMDGLFCSSCGDPLFLIMPCNLCPVCTHHL